MMYKKIYIEITNNCNLKCPFCTHNKRKNAFMDIKDYEKVLEHIKGYTKYVYLHVLGEPLLHPAINEIIKLTHDAGVNLNITTNGYLIDKIKENHDIRQVNISLQSYDGTIPLNDYLDKIFEVINSLKKDTYFNLRLWVSTPKTREILDKINMYYNKNISFNDKNDSIKLEDNVYLTFHKEFTWPSLNAERKYLKGTCYALRDHIGILVDGTIVPCCLDADGIINLGNIFKDDLGDIISQKRHHDMLQGFKDHKRIEPLCQTCHFIEK